MAEPGGESARVREESIPPESDTDLDRKEAAGISSGRDLPREAEEAEHGRSETLRNVLHWVICGGVVVYAVLFLLGTVAFLIHVMGPQCWRWLTVEDLTTLHTIGSSAALSILVSELGRKVLGKMK